MKKRPILVFLIMLGTSIASLLYSEQRSAGATKIATFAGGCFWCTQKDFDTVPGVVSTIAGYTGGIAVNPSYEEVSAGGTGHVEAVQVVYDSNRISYQKLLEIYFHSVDPTDSQGQFCDRGNQYRPVIFVHSPEQEREAMAYRAKLSSDKPFEGKIRVEIAKAGPFYPAEEYHQKYYKKNPIRYRFYRFKCGRDKRLKELWKS